MSGYKYLRGSDGTGNAVLAHITSPRSPGSTALIVDSLSKWSPFYTVTTGTLDVNGYMTPSSMTEMLAHTTAGQIIIDGFVPGFTDLGNTAGQVAIIKPTNNFANSVVDNALLEHNDDGSHNNITANSLLVSGSDPTVRHLYANAILNGGCVIAQRATPNISTAYQYGKVDRFAAKATGTTVTAGTIDQTAAPNAVTEGYALKIAGLTTTGSGIAFVRYRMESKDAILFKNKAASFRVRVYHDAGVALNYTIYIRKPTVADDFTAVTDIANSGAISVATATATEIKFENINAGSLGDVTNGIEIEIQVAVGAITTKNFEFSQFVFNLGAKRNLFSPRPFPDELSLCQRYFEKSYNYATVPGTATTSGQYTAFAINTIDVYAPNVFYKVTKRITPTVTPYSPATGASGKVRNNQAGTDITPNINGVVESNETKFYFYLGSGGIAANQSAGVQWAADAEL